MKIQSARKKNYVKLSQIYNTSMENVEIFTVLKNGAEPPVIDVMWDFKHTVFLITNQKS